MIDEIKTQLYANKDISYQKFSCSLLPGVNDILGVKLPILRKIASKIAKNNFKEFFDKNDHNCMELTMLQGMTIGEIKDENFETVLKYIEDFIPKINCWSVCDSFCSGLKIIKKNKPAMKAFLKKYLNSNKEYELRFAYVILLNYFIDDDFNYVIKQLIQFNNEQYYAKMAAAWCLSICFIKNFDKTIEITKIENFNKWVLLKGITKAIESYRLDLKQKNILKQLKKLI